MNFEFKVRKKKNATAYSMHQQRNREFAHLLSHLILTNSLGIANMYSYIQLTLRPIAMHVHFRIIHQLYIQDGKDNKWLNVSVLGILILSYQMRPQ